MDKDKYFFGTRLARQLDYYAFLRTGSHFLWNCFTGLFDLVFFENEFVIFSFLALVLLCIGRYTHSEGLKNIDEDIQYRRRGMYFSRYSNYVSLVGVAFYIAHIVMSF